MTIDDQVPSETALKSCVQWRQAAPQIGDFRLVVAVDPFNHGVSSIVWRKGDKWRIDMCQSENTLPQNMWGVKPPDGLGWGDPIAEWLKLNGLARI